MVEEIAPDYPAERAPEPSWRLHWIWWDSIELTARWLHSIAFWFFEVTAVAFTSAFVAFVSNDWLSGLVAGWLFLFGSVALVWIFNLCAAAFRNARYIYARDAIYYMANDSAWLFQYGARIIGGAATRISHACTQLSRDCMEGKVRAIGVAPRTTFRWSKIDRDEWVDSCVDSIDILNRMGSNGRLAAYPHVSGATQYAGYADVMFHRGDLLARWPRAIDPAATSTPRIPAGSTDDQRRQTPAPESF